MDDNRILTNKIFKQKINELVGADVVELEAANDDLALNCKVFETGMDAVKELISGGGSSSGGVEIVTLTLIDAEHNKFRGNKTVKDLYEIWPNGMVYVDVNMEDLGFEGKCRIPLYNVGYDPDDEKPNYYASGVFIVMEENATAALYLDGTFNEGNNVDEWRIEFDMPDDNNEH